MGEQDRERWDRRWTEASTDAGADGGGDGADRGAASHAPTVPACFAHVVAAFPTSGAALDVACGPGAASVWLAMRGMRVLGVDVSPVAIAQAESSARAHDVADTCRFAVRDLDAGLPSGDPVDLVLCHRFRDPALYVPIVERVTRGGLVAIAVLSEVGADPGPFRAPPGELAAAFSSLEVIDEGEADGHAWLLGRRR